MHLTYETPAGSGCPSRAELVEQIAARVGYVPIEGDAEESVAVQVAVDHGSFRGSLVAVHASALADARTDAGASSTLVRRGFASRDCRELVASMAFSIALYMDPILAAPTPPSASLPAASGRASVDAGPWRDVDPFETPPLAKAAAPSSEGLWIGAALGASIALAPGPSLGPRAAIGWRNARWNVALEGRVDLPLSSRSASGLDVRASLVGAALVPCARRGWAFGCLELTVGRYEATASGPGVERSASEPFVMPGARLGAEWAASDRASVHAFLYADAPLTRARLLVANDAVWQSGALAGGVAIGGAWGL